MGGHTERTDDTGSCAACTYGLDVVASINASATTCPEGLYEGEENFTVSYAVMVSGDAATFYYAGSGNPVGSGNSTDGSASFLTEGVCAWLCANRHRRFGASRLFVVASFLF